MENVKMVISPAKSMDFKSVVPTEEYSKGQYYKEASEINTVLKTMSASELSTLMKISDKLGQLNYERNQEWHLPFTIENAKQAVFAFSGDVYTGLDAYSLKEKQIKKMQDSLRILSGQYGMLKPLDLVQPYRLEMGTKIAIGAHKNLYAFWKEKLTAAINAEFEADSFLVNLASNEYFKALDAKKIKVPIVVPHFKDYKNGKLKIISFFAKKARGMMVRYILENDIRTVEDLKGFAMGGYGFDANLSNENDLVFTR
ncbi:MAG: peroxide stress protein YaaA [Flavobacteriaceae bacterium]|nr:peroxide stress protein YaaA [Flavobacteriaceae bacterium]